jgi:uncharacterized membrane protein
MNPSSPARPFKTAVVVFTAFISNLMVISSAIANDLSNWRVIQIPGATAVRALGINTAGQVAGTYSTIVGGLSVDHGFIRQRDGAITTVDVNASAGTEVTGINDKGEVCGSSGFSGFIREPDGSITTVIQPPGGGYDVILYGINDSGEVLGVGKNYFLREPDGTIINLHLTGALAPLGINNSGQIVGFAVEPVTGLFDGFLMNSDGSTIIFQVPGAVGGTIAAGINNLGQIVGSYALNSPQYPNQFQNRGFVRDTDGTITTFDAPQLGSTTPNGIADNGTIAASFSRNSNGLPPNIGLVRKCILCP